MGIARSSAVRLAAVLLILIGSPAIACMCSPREPPLESFDRYELVFTGRVVAIDSVILEEIEALGRQGISSLKALLLGVDSDDDPYSDYSIEVTFAVHSQFKGPEDQTVRLMVRGTSCDYEFKKGRDYLVYAYQADDGSFSTGKCSRTAPLASSAAEVELLDMHSDSARSDV